MRGTLCESLVGRPALRSSTGQSRRYALVGSNSARFAPFVYPTYPTCPERLRSVVREEGPPYRARQKAQEAQEARAARPDPIEADPDHGQSRGDPSEGEKALLLDQIAEHVADAIWADLTGDSEDSEELRSLPPPERTEK